ncbi:MAG: hypothetical protein JO264_01435 [Acidisphaera sp.]|nr:hypothetical protein [Acidisphaera sp.]
MLKDGRDGLLDLEVENVCPEAAAELLKQAAVRDRAMFEAAMGMDQRAAVLTAGFTAASGALAAGGFSIWSTLPGLAHAILLGAAMLAIAAVACGYAARPQKSQFPGVAPEKLGTPEYMIGLSLVALHLSLADTLQSHISELERKQTANGKILTVGLMTAALSPLVAVLIWTCGGF